MRISTIFDYINKNFVNIREVMEAAQPLVEDMVKYHREYYKEKDLPFTESVEADIRIHVLSDLLNCLSNYILPSDEISDTSFETGRNASIIIRCRVTRDGQPFFFGTQVIIAHGCIQRRHYRYIPDTNLRKLGVVKSPLTIFINDLKKSENKLKKLEDELVRLYEVKCRDISSYKASMEITIDYIRDKYKDYNYDNLNEYALKLYADRKAFQDEIEGRVQKEWEEKRTRYTEKGLNKLTKYYDKLIEKKKQQIEDQKNALDKI